MSQPQTQPLYERCPACGGRFRRLRHQWLFVCPDCGLLSSTLEPQIPASAGKSLIDEERRAHGLNDIRRRNNSIILDTVVEKLRSDSKRLLDVGSGLGFFVKDASARGFQVVGIEPDANAVEEAQRIGLNVRHGYFPECVESSERFDVIAFNDVFEHIPDIVKAIEACKNHLSRQGLLVLNCPNRRGAFYRISDLLDRVGLHGAFDRMWQRDLPSPHLWYFSPADLAKLGERNGLKVAKTLELLPITLRGIWRRIFYVRGQSKVMGAAALIATLFLTPFLSIFPRDIGVVVFEKDK